MSPHTFAILFLPGFIRDFLCDDGIACSDNFMHQTAMQALAMSRQLAFLRSQTPSSDRITPAVFPGQCTLFHTSFGIIILWIIDPPLSVELALQAAFLVLLCLEFTTEGEQSRPARLRHNGDSRRPKIKANRCRSHVMLWLLIGNALQDKLSVVAIALPISALGLWARGATAKESHVLDTLVKSMFHNRIIPINERREAILLEDEVARTPFFWNLEDETQALLVGLALHTV